MEIEVRNQGSEVEGARGQTAGTKYLVATRNHHHRVSDIAEKNAPFDDWQEENTVGHVADVNSGRGHDGIATFRQVHNTTVEIGDDQLRINGDRRRTRKRCEIEQRSRPGGQGEMRGRWSADYLCREGLLDLRNVGCGFLGFPLPLKRKLGFDASEGLVGLQFLQSLFPRLQLLERQT